MERAKAVWVVTVGDKAEFCIVAVLDYMPDLGEIERFRNEHTDEFDCGETWCKADKYEVASRKEMI